MPRFISVAAASGSSDTRRSPLLSFNTPIIIVPVLKRPAKIENFLWSA
jgi:hypothetical protein